MNVAQISKLAMFGAVGFFMMSGVASAENGHAYNGSYCKAYYGTQSAQFNHQYNGIRNTTSSGLYVNCPVIVDEIAKTEGTTQVWAHYTGGGTVSCSLRSMNGNGSIRQNRNGSRVGTGWISFANITSDDYWGSYSMYCLLPGGGTLNTIWLGEKN